jgi:hypothetical protein
MIAPVVLVQGIRIGMLAGKRSPFRILAFTCKNDSSAAHSRLNGRRQKPVSIAIHRRYCASHPRGQFPSRVFAAVKGRSGTEVWSALLRSPVQCGFGPLPSRADIFAQELCSQTSRDFQFTAAPI